MSARCMQLTLTGAGGYTTDVPKSNMIATTDPSTSSDDTQGYVSGSVWVNVTGGRVWTCQSNATLGAVWIQHGPGPTGSAGNQGGISWSWSWSTATGGSSTNLEVNNATYSAATSVLAATSTNGNAVGSTLAHLVRGDYLFIYLNTDYTRWILYKVTSLPTGTGGSLATIPVSWVANNGTAFANFSNVTMQICKAGPPGGAGGAVGSTPTGSGGTGLRSTGLPGVIAMDTGSDDEAGSFSATTGGTPLASNIVATITFSTAYANVPKAVILTPGNEATAVLAAGQQPYVKQVNTTASKFEVWSGTTALAGPGSQYKWHYAVRCIG